MIALQEVRPCLPTDGTGGQMDTRLRATGAGQESSSFLIPQERKLRDILVLLLSVPPKRGKGTSPLFLHPTFRPRRASPRILLSVTLSCSFDRRVDTYSATVFSPVQTISPSRNWGHPLFCKQPTNFCMCIVNKHQMLLFSSLKKIQVRLLILCRCF